MDADIATAEAHLVAGRADKALTLIERALNEAASLKAATLLPSRTSSGGRGPACQG